MKELKAIVIYGPTVTGKTDLALQIVRKFGGELISADSRQVYRGLDIGTGKVSFDAKVEKHQGYWLVDGIRINGFDLINPPVFEPGSKEHYESGSEQGSFSAVDFLKFAHHSMIQIIKLKKLPIVVGGTGFYIKALIDGIGSIGIPADQKLRRDLEKLSPKNLYQKLLKIDLHRAQSMNQSDRQNPRRLIRAIEIAIYNQYQESTIKPSSRAQVEGYQANTKYKIPASPAGRLNTKYILLGLTAPNNYLYSRADKWLDMRLSKGMVDEVKALIEKGIDPKWLENLGLEYRWLTRYLLGKVKKDEAIERLRGDIHSFIRRQKTWFNQLKGIKIFDISKLNWQDILEKELKS